MIKQLNNCVCCENSDLKLILDLGNQPLANNYLSTEDQIENIYPLALNYCKTCTHLQLTHKVDPDLLFKNYLYVSGTAVTNRKHFEDFVNISKQYVPNRANNVLDVACNDGTQLMYYKQLGYNTYGIDPAKNLIDISSKYGNIICDYLTTESINKFNTIFDIIIAQNVFAHISNPIEFLTICKSKLSDIGRIFIQTSQSNMVQNGEYDTIYHEHISFFNIHSIKNAISKAGLVLLDVINKPIHGNSYIFVIGKYGTQYNIVEPKLSINDLNKYVRKVHRINHNLIKTIEIYKSIGYTIVGYGAAAKGNTVLNFGKIKLDYIVDDNELKHGLYTPGQHIKIYPTTKLTSETGKLLVIPLAWNFYNEIKQKCVTNTKTKWLRYFPEITIE